MFNSIFLVRANRVAYYSRALAYSIVTAIVVTGIHDAHFTDQLLWVIPYLMLYPHVSFFGSRWAQKRYPKCCTASVLLAMDTVHAGILLVLMGFSAVPSLGIFVLLFFHAHFVRPFSVLIMMFLLYMVASSATQLVFSMPLTLETPLLTALVSMALVLLYLGLISRFFSAQAAKQESLKKQLFEEQKKHDQLAQDLAKYLTPQIWQMVFKNSGNAHLPRTQRKKLTVFFSDIKGFTDLSEELEPEDLAEILNSYLTEMSQIAIRYGGTIDKFMGDCVMVFFGDPRSGGAKHDALSAVSMAIEMRKHMHVLRQQWQAKGINKPLEIRMGINTGYCTVGSFGADSRMDYTIIGREVNLASRLESAAEANEILISSETYSLIKGEIMGRTKGQIQVKGFMRPVHIFQVVDYRRDLGPGRSYLSHELPGFSLQMDTDNISTQDKEVVIEALNLAAQRLRDNFN